MNSIELQQGNKRIEWIDCVKGLGIILVYIGHTYIPSVNGLIYSFHMPLFFIISGFLWNDSKYKSMPFRVFITTKFRAYILPYLKIASICFVVWGIIYGLFRFDSITDYFKQLLDYLYGIVIVYARRDYMPECSPIWFLVALFFAEMLFYFAKKTRIISLIVLLSAIVGYGSSRIGINPFCLGTAFSVMPFIFVGNCIKNNQWLFKHKLLTGIVGGGHFSGIIPPSNSSWGRLCSEFF